MNIPDPTNNNSLSHLQPDDCSGRATPISSLLSEELRDALHTLNTLAGLVLNERRAPTAEPAAMDSSVLSELEQSFNHGLKRLICAACDTKEFQEASRRSATSAIEPLNEGTTESLDDLLSSVFRRDGAVVTALLNISGRLISSDPQFVEDVFVGESNVVGFDFDTEGDDFSGLEKLVNFVVKDLSAKDLVSEAVTFQIPSVGFFTLEKSVSIEGEVPQIRLGYFREKPNLDDVISEVVKPKLEFWVVLWNGNNDSQQPISEAAERILDKAISIKRHSRDTD